MFAGNVNDVSNRYKALIDNMIDGFSYHKIIFDDMGNPCDFTFEYVNQSFESVCGLKKDFVLNNRVRDLFPDMENFYINFIELGSRAALNGESIQIEAYSPPVNKWFSYSIFSYEPGYFATIFHDITEAKLADQKVKESEEFLKLALNGTGDGIWDWNIETDKVTYSYAYNNILGYEPGEIPDDWKSWMNYLHPEDAEATRKCMAEHLSGITPNFHFEYRFRCKDGSYKWLLSRGKITQYSAQGKPVRATGTHSDITNRKNTEQALKESEEKYRSIFTSVRDAIFIADSATGNILAANPSACDLYGYSAEEMLKLNRIDFVLDTAQMVENIKQNLSHLSIYHKKKDGTVFPVDMCISKAIFGNETVRIITVRDITNRKLVEDLKNELQKNLHIIDEAKIYENLRTEFFANISHELRTPLNVILSSLQLINLFLTQEADSFKRCRYSKYTKIMQQNCFRLLRLVNNLIDISKIDAGYLDLCLENRNIVSIVEDITLSVAEYTNNKSINLIFDTEIEEKIMAVDSDMIERIMLNLLSNAIKFTPPDGSIYVNLYEGTNNVIISVKDTGSGMPEDKLKVIFDRFMQVDKSLARSREGSGIGLSLVKSLVELHDGFIYVESKLDEGSEFIIELPVKLTQECEAACTQELKDSNSHVERIHIEFSDIYS